MSFVALTPQANKLLVCLFFSNSDKDCRFEEGDKNPIIPEKEIVSLNPHGSFHLARAWYVSQARTSFHKVLPVSGVLMVMGTPSIL